MIARPVLSGIIGVIHLAPMPGDPRNDGAGFDDVLRNALRDAKAWVKGGVGAMVVENFGSAPFVKGTEGARLPAHQAALTTRVATEIRRLLGAEVGINCLRNDGMTAIGIAAAAGAAFVRVNVLSGTYVTDQGVIEGEAASLLRYRDQLRARHVQIWADILVKHAKPLGVTDPVEITKDTLDRGGANAVIVTGARTGSGPDEERVLQIVEAAAGRAVYTGSGGTPEMLAKLRAQTGQGLTGAIVGTWAKEGGVLSAPVDAGRVAELVAAWG